MSSLSPSRGSGSRGCRDFLGGEGRLWTDLGSRSLCISGASPIRIRGAVVCQGLKGLVIDSRVSECRQTDVVLFLERKPAAGRRGVGSREEGPTQWRQHPTPTFHRCCPGMKPFQKSQFSPALSCGICLASLCLLPILS